MDDLDQQILYALHRCDEGIGGWTTGELIKQLVADNHRLRAACEAVHARLETMDYDITGLAWCYLTLGNALAPAAAGGEGT